MEAVTEKFMNKEKTLTNREMMNEVFGLPKDHQPPNESPTKAEPLKGNYFHRLINGKLTWQGVILRQWDQYVLILTFEWLMGNPSCRYLMKISDLAWDEETQTGFYLYGDHASFEYSYQDGMAHSAEVRNREKAAKE
jgi:hypothetical protein